MCLLPGTLFVHVHRRIGMYLRALWGRDLFMRPTAAWATVLEKRPKCGEHAVVDKIIDDNRKLTQRLKHLLDALQPQGVQRIRKQEEGDEVDINAAIRALVDIRLGSQPDPRVMMRSLRKTRDIAVLVLLDLSESTNDTVAGQDFTVLELTRAATVLLGEAIHTVGASRRAWGRRSAMPGTIWRKCGRKRSCSSSSLTGRRPILMCAIRIFGARNYLILDHVERLPERLPLLYAGLTR